MTTPATPVADPDMAAAATFWHAYVNRAPEVAEEHPTVEAFGDSAELADDLVARVLDGRLRAIATPLAELEADEQPLPRIGGYRIICNGRGVPDVVVRSIYLRLGQLESVDDAFVHDASNGEYTRENWVAEHLNYWRRVTDVRGRAWPRDLEVIFERFEVVHRREPKQ